MFKYGVVILMVLIVSHINVSETNSESYKNFFKKIDDVPHTNRGSLVRVQCQTGYVKVRGICREIF